MPVSGSAEAVALGLALADRLPACLGLMEERIQRIDQANPVIVLMVSNPKNPASPNLPAEGFPHPPIGVGQPSVLPTHGKRLSA